MSQAVEYAEPAAAAAVDAVAEPVGMIAGWHDVQSQAVLGHTLKRPCGNVAEVLQKQICIEG